MRLGERHLVKDKTIMATKFAASAKFDSLCDPKSNMAYVVKFDVNSGEPMDISYGYFYFQDAIDFANEQNEKNARVGYGPEWAVFITDVSAKTFDYPI